MLRLCLILWAIIKFHVLSRVMYRTSMLRFDDLN